MNSCLSVAPLRLEELGICSRFLCPEPGVSRTQIFIPFIGEGADILRKGLCLSVTPTVCLKLRVIQLG